MKDKKRYDSIYSNIHRHNIKNGDSFFLNKISKCRYDGLKTISSFYSIYSVLSSVQKDIMYWHDVIMATTSSVAYFSYDYRRDLQTIHNRANLFLFSFYRTGKT